MKLSRFMFLVLVGLMVMGCSTFHYPTQKADKFFTIPEVGIDTTAYLGEPIILTGSGYYTDGIIVNNTAESFNVMYSFKIGKGFYELVYSDGKYRYYYPEDDKMLAYYNVYKQEDNGGMELRMSNDGSIGLLNNIGGYFSANSMKSKLNIEMIENRFITSKASLQQTVIYTGKQDNILKFSYREFSNDMARPAFTTDITYDLNESNIIGYKSFRAEVIQATNTEIRYKIINGF